jgi:hypothetical protein
MLFYWFISGLRRFIWFFRIPKPEDLARIDVNARCPNCGAREGRIRCVLQAKPGPRASNAMPDGQILCQHICNLCGARWHEKPIAKDASPSTVLPSVARTDLERREDNQAYMQAEETAAS